ncbi:SCAN domain-containing protein 3-like [Acyrthosiphon pisum]|uniref:Integrase catalytic domain-containing protein n=2 Tax=Acyrthosiphon pisum TaxID=7029 RepID=A0A8R2NW56_ACYPI|nr:SCAN domain-containing protein 3-like [Acyrthosiphon pisum]|eukprot:XP_008187846.1 PREDICTED: SCAN domain-containing protein 3-like [Acyrthosiphon pisum]
MVRKYEILMVNGKERLIKPVSDNNNIMLYYVSNEELFDILHTTHSSIGHGGRNRMVAEIKNKPLKSKRAEEIAYNLLDIYTTFGAPAILQSDNGREFVNSTITELHNMWEDVKIVHGKPRHSQSQGSVERANRDVEDMLATWMAEKNSTDWPSGLKFIQFQKNRALHSGIGRSPYEAMFGCTARTGLLSIGLPNDEINSLKTEEDIEELFNQMQETGLHDSTQNIEEIVSPIAEKQENMIDTDANLRKCEMCFIFLEADNESTNCMNCQRHEQIQNERHKSSECLKKQAKKMMTISNKKFSPLEVGTTVKVSIPDVDRARGSPRNLLAVITQVEDDLYKLGTENGIIKHMYTRSQIDPCKESFVDLESVNTEKEITLREAASFNNVTGSQGYRRCNCKLKCRTNKCICRSAGILCNSKCHNSMPCENK